MKILKISGITEGTSNKDIEDIFSRLGEVSDVFLFIGGPLDKPCLTGEGTVIFKDDSKVDEAIEKYNGININGGILTLTLDNRDTNNL